VGEQQSLGQYLHDWLQTIKPPTLEYSTWRGYEQYVRLHLAPTLGRIKVAKLTPQHLQQLYADKLTEGRSSTTVHHLHACIHKALEDGLRFGLVQRNVADLVRAPPMRKSAMRAYTPEQVRTLTSGMREGELLGLQWCDVNLETGLVHIQGTLKVAAAGKRALGKPKTSGSRRKIVLTATAVEALRAHRVRQDAARQHMGIAWHDTDLVFPNTIGNALDPTNFYRYQFKPLLKRAGLPPLRFHDCRHTAATLLLLSGIHLKVVSEMLGHSSVTITLNLYSRVLPDMQKEAMAAMERLLNDRAAEERR
jgi:integrase